MIKNLALVLIVHLLVLTNLTFTAWPEMLSYPYLLAHGFDYHNAVIPYPIGLLVPLGLLYKIFGFNPSALKIFTWISLLITDVVVFLILKKLAPKGGVLIFLFIYILLSSVLDGNMMWFDNATVLPLALVFYFSIKWLKDLKPTYLFFTGVAVSAAIVIKQTAFVYLIPLGLFYIFVAKLKLKNLFFYFLGSSIFVVPFLIFLMATNSFIDFWSWAIYYPLTIWSNIPGYVRFSLSRSELLISLLLLLPLIGISSTRKKITDKLILLNITLFFCALMAIYPRFSYFHLQPVLLFLVILYFQVTGIIQDKLLFISLIIMTTTTIFTLLAPLSIDRSIRFYSREDQIIAQEIVSRVGQSEEVFLLGLNSLYYVLANRLPPKPWVDNYSWYLEIPGVQEQLIEGLKKDGVRVIFRKVPGKGAGYDLNVYQPQKVVNFIKSEFSLKETVDDIEVWRKN